MKILHIVPSYIPAYRYGGPVKAVHELCRTLVQKGLDISVFTTNIDGERNLDVPLNSPQDIEGVNVTYYSLGFPRKFCYSRGLARALSENVSKFDIVHIHSVFRYPTFIAARLCRLYKKPYIINPFGVLNASMIKLRGCLRKMIYIQAIERYNLEKATVIHVASEYERNNILSLGFNVSTKVVPRGLDLEAYSPFQPEEFIEKYPQLAEKKIILFLGRVNFQKGLDLLGLALEKVIEKRKDVILIIAGSDEKGHADKAKKLFRRLGVVKHILFTGMLLEHSKISALHSSDIFVLPSYGESFAIAALEAMACKLPVVITDRVGLYPDVKEYNAGIVTECNSNNIADAILRLLDNEDLRKTMGENGRRLVENRFTLDKVTDRMITVYKEIIKG